MIDSVNCGKVTTNDFSALSEATQALIGSDRKHIVLLSTIHKLNVGKLRTQGYIKAMEAAGLKFQKATFYRTVCSDLSDLADVDYDMLVFFSPSGIESLFKNFPDFKQNNTKIAAFGNATVLAADKAKLRIDIKAPTPDSPSMSMAIERYINNKDK